MGLLELFRWKQLPAASKNKSESESEPQQLAVNQNNELKNAKTVLRAKVNYRVNSLQFFTVHCDPFNIKHTVIICFVIITKTLVNVASWIKINNLFTGNLYLL